MTRNQFLEQVKRLLEDAFGERLKGVVLYGSEARGEAKEDSDIDFLVLLKGPVNFGQDLRAIIHVLYPLQLEIIDSNEFGDNRSISARPVDALVYKAGEFALYRNAKREGVFL